MKIFCSLLLVRFWDSWDNLVLLLLLSLIHCWHWRIISLNTAYGGSFSICCTSIICFTPVFFPTWKVLPILLKYAIKPHFLAISSEKKEDKWINIIATFYMAGTVILFVKSSWVVQKILSSGQLQYSFPSFLQDSLVHFTCLCLNIRTFFVNPGYHDWKKVDFHK